jgi:hypothetical protein
MVRFLEYIEEMLGEEVIISRGVIFLNKTPAIRKTLCRVFPSWRSLFYVWYTNKNII